MLPAEIAVVVASVLAASIAVHAQWRLSLAVLAMCLVVNYHSGRETTRPGLPHVGRILRDTGLPIVAVAVGISVGVLSPGMLSDSLFLVAAAAGVAVAATAVRRRMQGQARLIMVGDKMAIASAATRWAGDPRAKVVGALLLEPEADETDMLNDAFGVHAIEGIHQVAEWASTWDADMVVVAPGPTVRSEDVRRLGWYLQGAHASLAVLGALNLVAPHRIDATRFAGVTLQHVRSSRPSVFIRGVKTVGDRITGAFLLVLVSPLLLAMSALVRMESDGPGFFRQERVGKDGKPFTMYKMRTMCQDAEAMKATLAAIDEGNGVLFKIKQDPRITKVGGILRKTSLDELPQLINVVKGEMSLIGPRPALPQEVATYDDTARRRLAVRPGITGLWQVSGRSNLSWERSIELDLSYTDNWRLTDDLMITLKTVDAVTRTRGAY